MSDTFLFTILGVCALILWITFMLDNYFAKTRVERRIKEIQKQFLKTMEEYHKQGIRTAPYTENTLTENESLYCKKDFLEITQQFRGK